MDSACLSLLFSVLHVRQTLVFTASLGKLPHSFYFDMGTMLSVTVTLVSEYCHDIICFENIHVV